MSLLSAETRIALLPRRVGLALAGKPGVVSEAKEGALFALEALLSELRPKGRASVTLSHHHARLFLLAAPAARLRRQEMRPWLQAQLAEALGGEVADWSLTWDLPAPAAPILVAAMEQRLQEELRTTLGRHGMTLGSTRPWLATAWSRRRQLAHASGWYALLEPGRTTLLRLLHGRAVSLRQRHSGEAVAAELRAMLTRESLIAGVSDAGELWLERAGVSNNWESLRASHRVHELAGPADPALALLS